MHRKLLLCMQDAEKKLLNIAYIIVIIYSMSMNLSNSVFKVSLSQLIPFLKRKGEFF